MASDFATFENALQFIGAFVAFSIALVAYKGVRETASSSMLRLAAAFVFLGSGFVLEGLEGVGAFASVPVLEVSLATILIAAMFLQTVGYFFLAFSHVLDVVLSRRLGPLLVLIPIFAVSQTSVETVLRSLSFYFILYGVLETALSYSKTKNPNTLFIATGLGLLAAGWWVSLAAPDMALLTLLQLLMREVGLIALFIPVLRFSFRKQGVVLNAPV
ncbi:MAG: hypothetical protein JRM86_06155 [Nitrososphaerota archaeon]|nr:hypothetical protein [Nitrososphaerota archaeon]MDG6967107.1 hypothetical protein [Nitrososphaerota archaeon]MDG6978105.1 hypothetical protein [Nitrososphaerota archaeon]MDG7006502.1 hypothetical protein [Nitrososphaerota archaeon]MDG7020325.1 hypothetical protein [Nitrososphaerota archaeon]